MARKGGSKALPPSFLPPQDSGVTSRAVDEEAYERARRAVRSFLRLQPTISGFAKMLTRNPDVRVVLHAGTPHTDGKTIYLRPPIELGDEIPHERALCDERGPDLMLLCPACAARERVLTVVYHEVAHIAFESFAKVEDSDRTKLLQAALDEAGAKDDDTRAAQIKARIDKIIAQQPEAVESYVGMVQLISPYLHPILNAIEDWRVNREMYRARPGTYAMFYAQIVEVLEKGIQNADGSWATWQQMPPNAQAVVGLFTKLCGYDYSGWFIPEVVHMLNSSEVNMALMKASTIRSVRATYQLGFPVLEAFRAHGFCVAADDPESAPGKGEGTGSDGQGDGDESGEGEGEPGEGENDGTGTAGIATVGRPTRDMRPGGSPNGSGAAPGGNADDRDDDGADQGADDTDQGADDTDEPGDSESDWLDSYYDDDDESDDGDDDTDDPTNEDGAGDDTHGESAGSPPGGSADEPDEAARQEAEQVQRALEVFGGHAPAESNPDPESKRGETKEQQEIDRAIVQDEFFDAPSRTMFGVREHYFDKHYILPSGGDLTENFGWTPENRAEVTIPESVLGRALMQMRVTFADNTKWKREPNLKSGRVNTRVLGRRLATGDDRLFHKRTRPGKRDYFVVIGLDVSGSTAHYAVHQIKAAALAQAELCHRTGVKFAVYAHSGSGHAEDLRGYGYSSHGLDLDIFVVKTPEEPWTAATRDRLMCLEGFMCNLDGHTLEYYRKVADRVKATDKVIMYYTDGAMPAENYDDELYVLQRELRTCRQKGYTVMGVGVGNDEPSKYGLDTVRLDGIEDVPNVVRHLEKRLTGGSR